MTETEDLIVSAMRLQAERRPDGASVRAGLADGHRRRSGRAKLLLVAATAAVVAGLAIGAVQFRGPADHTAQPAAQHSALSYRPHWLPAGLVERARESQGTGTSRLWATPKGTLIWYATGSFEWNFAMGQAIQLTTEAGGAMPSGNPAADINGHSGQVVKTPGTSEYRIVWTPEPGLILTVHGTTTLDAALRVARSVRPDDHAARIDPQVTFTKLPAGWTQSMVSVSGESAAKSDTELRVRMLGKGYDVTGVFTWFPATHGQQPGNSTIQLADGSYLRVWMMVKYPSQGMPPIADLLAYAKHNLTAHPDADVSWLGTP